MMRFSPSISAAAFRDLLLPNFSYSDHLNDEQRTKKKEQSSSKAKSPASQVYLPTSLFHQLSHKKLLKFTNFERNIFLAINNQKKLTPTYRANLPLHQSTVRRNQRATSSSLNNESHFSKIIYLIFFKWKLKHAKFCSAVNHAADVVERNKHLWSADQIRHR